MAILAVTQAQAAHIGVIVALDVLIIGDERRRELLTAAVAHGHVLIVEADGQLAGLLVWDQHFFGQPFVELLEVHPTWRRRGVASALLAAMEERATPGKLFTSTNQSNLPMQALCAARGYLAAGVVLHLDPGDPELIFVKLLG